MKTLIVSAVAFLASTTLVPDASAISVSPPPNVLAEKSAIKIYHRGPHHRRASAPFRNWCAYNCYAVRPGARGPFGAYAYSRFPYDQDIPFRYRYDYDASPIDNGLGLAYPYTGEPFWRLFERTY